VTQNPSDYEAMQHAKWMRDAMDATKQAAEVAKAYPVLEAHEMEVPRPDRAIAFHEKNSGPDATLQDALMDAMRFFTPPSELREIETNIRVRKLEDEVTRLKSELQSAHDHAARCQEALLASVSAAPESDDGDE
jgi:hypothetical protein